MIEPADLFPQASAASPPLYYDSAVHLVANSIDNGVFHSAWMSAEYAVALVERGSAAEIERAEAVLAAVLTCQDTDPRSPHQGNFRWEHEDPAVEDLNAVQFVLVRLIPLLLARSDRLSAPLVEQIKARIRLGLDAIRRIDVSPIYSNIVAQDIANSILGGQLLNAPEYSRRGLAKLRAWQAIIDKSGIPHEYNSPSYSFVCIEALHKIVILSTLPKACALARLIISRIGLSLALRIHPEMGRLAPPHCRAYYPQLTFESPPEAAILGAMIAEGKLPAWLETVQENRPTPMMVSETSDVEAGVVISSYLDADFSLGVASQELATQSNRFISNQSNVFSIHYTKEGAPRPGVVFSRYLINDKWLGDYRTTPSRTSDHVFRDEGSFRGAQAGPRAIGLYTSPELDAWSRCSSAKAVLIWNRAEDVDEIWIDDAPIRELPIDVPERSVIVFGCGNVYILVRPLQRSKLGLEAPVRIVEHRGCLVIEMYNYLGPAKTFWELANPGAFFQGGVRNGFFVEVLRRDQFGSGKDVVAAFGRGRLLEECDEACTFDGDNQRNWRLAYRDEAHELGIEVDTMRWAIQRRWADGADLGFPMLASPVAVQARSSLIELGDARLRCGSHAAWLLGLPNADLWVGAYHGPEAAPFTLELPPGRVHIERMEAGLVVWDSGHVVIEAPGLQSAPEVVGAKSVSLGPPAS
ncbi:MAG: hypothetical protein OXN88_07645 [Chloroflexota bacterium]|nr:hypothetical protein [Chloroflexota bacterium]